MEPIVTAFTLIALFTRWDQIACKRSTSTTTGTNVIQGELMWFMPNSAIDTGGIKVFNNGLTMKAFSFRTFHGKQVLQVHFR
jgi:hypothetical protein